MKKIRAELVALVAAIEIFVFATILLGVWATHPNYPTTGTSRNVMVLQSYTPQYASAIEQIAEERGVKPWQVSIACQYEYGVSVADADSGYVGAGKRSIPVWYLCVNGLKEPIYAEADYLTTNDLFDLTVEDINPAVSNSVAGYTATELVKMNQEWFDSLSDLTTMLAAAEMEA